MSGDLTRVRYQVLRSHIVAPNSPSDFDKALAALNDFVRRLVEDRERLDWLEANEVIVEYDGSNSEGPWAVQVGRGPQTGEWFSAATLRAAIDAARGATGLEQEK